VALVTAMRSHDRLRRACWAGFMREFDALLEPRAPVHYARGACPSTNGKPQAAGTARLRQALDPVVHLVSGTHDAARLARRAVLVEDTQDGRRERALARVAACARHDVVHRARYPRAEVRARVVLVDPPRVVALPAAE